MPDLAVVSDIHGNILALHAVMEDMARRGVSCVVDLGDDASGPLWPLETTRELMGLGWTHARGNHDRLIAEAAPESLAASDAFARRRLAEAERSWLGGLAVVARAGEAVSGFHGTPMDDEGYLVETVEGRRTRQSSSREVRERLSGFEAREVVLCGHTHLQRRLRLEDGALVVNPGSVGLPAYAERAGVPHVVESGSPHARYAILSGGDGSWSVEFLRVEYDWNVAADKARDEGRFDWESALRSGRMG